MNHHKKVLMSQIQKAIWHQLRDSSLRNNGKLIDKWRWWNKVQLTLKKIINLQIKGKMSKWPVETDSYQIIIKRRKRPHRLYKLRNSNIAQIHMICTRVEIKLSNLKTLTKRTPCQLRCLVNHQLDLLISIWARVSAI